VIKRSLLISILRSTETALSWVIWDASVKNGLNASVTNSIVNYVASLYGVDSILLLIPLDIILPFIIFILLYWLMSRIKIRSENQKLISRAVALTFYILIAVGLVRNLITIIEFKIEMLL
jgi:hypothetical protein